jgi:hypothetical protein
MENLSFEMLDKAWYNAMKGFEQAAVPMLRQNIDEFKYKATGGLQDSIGVDIGKGPKGFEVTVSMFWYGKVLERKERFSQKASVEDLAAWILKRGLDKFLYVPGYERSATLPDKAAERIAWAIKSSEKRSRANVPVFWSWFYRDYYRLFREHRQRYVNYIFTITADEVLAEVAYSNFATMDEMGLSKK